MLGSGRTDDIEAIAEACTARRSSADREAKASAPADSDRGAHRQRERAGNPAGLGGGARSGGTPGATAVEHRPRARASSEGRFVATGPES